VGKLEDKFQGIKLHHVPRKNNDATNFLTKLAARWVPSTDRVFINDLHEPSARILKGLIQTHPDANLALGGSDPGGSRKDQDAQEGAGVNWANSKILCNN